MSSKDYFTQAAVANRFVEGFNRSFSEHLNTIVSHKNAVEQAKIWRENMALQNETARLRNRITAMELDAYERSLNAPPPKYSVTGDFIKGDGNQSSPAPSSSFNASASNTNNTTNAGNLNKSESVGASYYANSAKNDFNLTNKVSLDKPFIKDFVGENQGSLNINTDYENVLINTENGPVPMHEYSGGSSIVDNFAKTYGKNHARGPLLVSDDLQDWYVNVLENSYYQDDKGNTVKFSDSELSGGPNYVVREKLAQQLTREANAAGIRITSEEVLDSLPPITSRNELAAFKKDLTIRKQLVSAIEEQYDWWGGNVAGWFGNDIDQQDVMSAIDKTMSTYEPWNELSDTEKGYQVTRTLEPLRRKVGNSYFGLSQSADMDVQGVKDYAVNLITRDSGKHVKTVEEYNKNLIDAVDLDDTEYLEKISIVGPDGIRKIFVNDQWMPLGELDTDGIDEIRTSNMIPAPDQGTDEYNRRYGLVDIVINPPVNRADQIGTLDMNPEMQEMSREDILRIINQPKPQNNQNSLTVPGNSNNPPQEKSIFSDPKFLEYMRKRREENRNSGGEQPPRI